MTKASSRAELPLPIHAYYYISWRRNILRFAGLLCAGAVLFAMGCQSSPVKHNPEATLPTGTLDSPSQRVASTKGSVEAKEVFPPEITTPGAPRGIHRYTSVVVDGPYIALTFDDGPDRRLTPELLDILKEREIPATFFVVGERVGANHNILRRMLAEGHEIGNHTWDHSALLDLDRESIRDQLMRTSYAIQAAVGERPTLMRPPYGRMDANLDQWLFETLGMTVIMWSVDSNDWRHRDADRVREEILAETRPGAVILCHDIHRSTVAAMPATLDALLARGFTFVTVSELITRKAAFAVAEDPCLVPTLMVSLIMTAEDT